MPIFYRFRVFLGSSCRKVHDRVIQDYAAASVRVPTSLGHPAWAGFLTTSCPRDKK